MTDSKTIRLERTLLLLWFMMNLVIGALTVHQYGTSIDEPKNYDYAADTLAAYPSFFGIRYEPKYDVAYEGHGPAFVTIVRILINLIQRVFPNVYRPDLWHFSYFVTFQLTGLCLYWLTKRWFNKWTAWGILILFCTQPVLLGHAFINPKDIPFMFFFAASVVFGFRLVDKIEAKESFSSLEEPAQVLSQKFLETDPRRRRKFLSFLALALITGLALIVFSRQINSVLEQVVTFFYTAEPNSWAGRLFGSVASRTSDITKQDYVTKALNLFRRAESGILIGCVFLFLAYFGLLISNRTLSNLLSDIWGQRNKLDKSIRGWARSLRNSLHLSTLKMWFTDIFRASRNRHLILAGIVLGLATAVRAVAPLAGMIVLLYLFVKIRSRAWTWAIAYFLVAGIVTYIAWPHLWAAPIQRYLEGLGIIADFPNYPGRVLFNGHLYGSSELPRSYLPVLLNIQFTEPFLLAAYVGLGMLGWLLLRSRLRTDLLLYVGLGFAFPLLGLMLLRTPLYHNFRQALFVIPPMFIFAAFTLELVFSKLSPSWAKALLIAAIALPGVYANIKLYPYEYVYYNSLVGGPAGVSNRYELDYWRISLREAAIKLNELAPRGAKVIVARSPGLFNNYARPDLVVDRVIDNTNDLNGGYDYVVQLARWRAWDLYPEAENVVLIERDGAVLATVKAVKNVSVK
ncbi:MAG TPA: hypothetical protein VK249_29280 [Anaerolineales bacterium]|nr:hypothetical protein [Anaerolineales bacterium]